MTEQLEEQASLYVLDLLEPEERRVFEGALETNSALRAYENELRDVAASLAHLAALRTPPPDLEAKIRAAILTEQRPAKKGALSVNWLPWALAASLLLACLLLAADRARLHQHVARLERRNAIAQVQIATLASQLESAPRANAVVLWDAEKQEGVLKVVNVPPNESNRDYQLWIVDPEYKQPVSAGVFHVEDEGTTRISFKPHEHVATAKSFAVSLERKGGVSKAQGPMVLIGK